MKFRLLLPIIAVLVVISACAPPPNLRDENLLKDTSLITGEPCEAPCWRNITPGETSWRDALVIVEDDPQMTNVDRVDDEENDVSVISWADGDAGVTCCQMVTSDGDTVESLTLLLAPQMQLSDVVDVLGEPEYLTGVEISADQALMLLIYPDDLIMVYVFVAGTAEGTLSETSEIVGSIYMTEDVMNEAIAATNLYLWDGYQSYADYIDEEFDITAEPELAEDDLTEVTEEPENTEPLED